MFDTANRGEVLPVQLNTRCLRVVDDNSIGFTGTTISFLLIPIEVTIEENGLTSRRWARQKFLFSDIPIEQNVYLCLLSIKTQFHAWPISLVFLMSPGWKPNIKWTTNQQRRIPIGIWWIDKMKSNHFSQLKFTRSKCQIFLIAYRLLFVSSSFRNSLSINQSSEKKWTWIFFARWKSMTIFLSGSQKKNPLVVERSAQLLCHGSATLASIHSDIRDRVWGRGQVHQMTNGQHFTNRPTIRM